MRVLVTGGAGFIGSHLAGALLARGDEVRILDNFSTGKRENLDELGGALEVLEGDIRDSALCFAAVKGVDAVLHQAALGSVPRSIEDPTTTHAVNVDGTLHLLCAAQEAGVRRFVFASSSSVYGNAPEKVKVESLPARPLSPYAVSKVAAEAYTLVFHHVYGLETVALRYFNVFGPRQDPDSMYAAVVPRFVSSLLALKQPTIFGDGNQSRDFTYVENVVLANLLALQCRPESCGKAYNVACGGSTSVTDVFRLLRESVGGEALRVDPLHEPPRRGDVRDSLASIDLARASLGYVPGIDVGEGIRETVEWYRSRSAAPTMTARVAPTANSPTDPTSRVST
jgi:nucleoside-diphosphate-sugar epimerase